MSKFYFSDLDDERCYTKDDIIEQMAFHDIDELKVYPAKMMRGESFAYCTKIHEPIDVRSGDCGKRCCYYKPRNGKSGRCCYSANCYEPAEEFEILKTKTIIVKRK